MIQDRRYFIKAASWSALAITLAPLVGYAKPGLGNGRKRVLLRSGWQSVNIGDIGHTFGMLSLLEQHLPYVEVVLWPKSFHEGEEQLMKRYFPNTRVVRSPIGEISPTLQAAFDECDLLIHCSGPYVVSQQELAAWWNATRKPFGVYGVSLDEVGSELASLLNHAAFFFCRDTESLKYLKTLRIECPVQAFAPDSTFGIRVYDDHKAEAYLDSVGLQRGKFICVIPRLRFTPYWQMVGRAPSSSEQERYAISMAFKERDAAKMRAVITEWVEATGLGVLICPEVTYQVEFGKETLYDPLPSAVKRHVAWRDSFWLPDEATSVYKQARAMVCCEPHSLIMAVANGVPSIHVKQSTDTRKGQMWRDIGLDDWYFLMDETPASQLSRALLDIHQRYDDALALVDQANANIKKHQKETFNVIKGLI